MDEDFAKTNFYQPSCFNDPLPIDTPTSLQPQREVSISPPLSTPPTSNILQPTPSSSTQHIDSDTPLETSNLPRNIHRGWNSSHCYETRFKKQHIAKLSSSLPHQPFTDDNLQAFQSSTDLHPINTDIHSSTLHQLAFSATHKDTLHFWELHLDPDCIHLKPTCRERFQTCFLQDP